MSTRPLASALAIVLTVALLAPSAFLIAPQRAHAIPVKVIGDIVGWVQQTISATKNTITAIETSLTATATIAKQVNDYVLQPIAFIKSGLLLKALTAGVIAFVIGQTNGTGSSQFVQDLQGNLQRVGDIQANAFFVQFGRNSNSPFSGAITSSLRTNYLQNTSSAGFLAANRNTLARYSPNPNAFLAGNWSQGGVGAWFALTTQTQNNPYTFYQASQSQLASVVGGATAARRAELNWGQGLLSWCGPSDNNAGDGANIDETTGAFIRGGAGISPGDPCKNSDGSSGTIKTPGSTIKATLDKALGGGQDKLVQIGNIGTQLNGILGSITTIMGTINLAKDVLGGPGSGGLAAALDSSAFQGSSPAAESAVLQGAANSAERLISDVSDKIGRYKTAWEIIAAAASAASASVTSLANSCTDQANAAQTALTTEVDPVLASSNTASTIIAAARAMIQQVQAATATIATDIQTLQTMPPTASDVATAEQDAQTTDQATASPSGSLMVSGGTLVDQMGLISTNAAALQTACAPSFGNQGP